MTSKFSYLLTQSQDLSFLFEADPEIVIEVQQIGQELHIRQAIKTENTVINQS